LLPYTENSEKTRRAFANINYPEDLSALETILLACEERLMNFIFKQPIFRLV